MFSIITLLRIYDSRVYGKPGTPEQPGSARTVKFLQVQATKLHITVLLKAVKGKLASRL